jgi:hypothetical protein
MVVANPEGAGGQVGTFPCSTISEKSVLEELPAKGTIPCAICCHIDMLTF